MKRGKSRIIWIAKRRMTKSKKDHKIRITKKVSIIVTMTNYYTGGEDEEEDKN